MSAYVSYTATAISTKGQPMFDLTVRAIAVTPEVMRDTLAEAQKISKRKVASVTFVRSIAPRIGRAPAVARTRFL